MKFRKMMWVLLCAVMLLLSACGEKSEGKAAAADLGELYSLALDAYMPVDEGLNSGMKYIAIDMSNLKDLDAGDKQQILAHFKSYKVDVMEASYEQLEAKGLFNKNTLSLDGVLLKVEKAELTAKQFVVEGSKYRSGDGAIGMRVVVKVKDGHWQVDKADMTWIS
ncbi:peptide ABC transporter substrate-binding protein [Paenibacillus lignilyticus]|uniref:Peptide ABC transporter substrate-binding protein n=1 Tax=Paenibacillus lignilyticus TaxID=1172615 RepID=A0ABS5CJR2_9BACL|nr:peptide ABC transporter substrate-binding protein [Paenibacillus lignilyticus]MBP3966056.1 peptide ABC transporter substrate-binding protein [Paenibacillus lignilyticus]